MIDLVVKMMAEFWRPSTQARVPRSPPGWSRCSWPPPFSQSLDSKYLQIQRTSRRSYWSSRGTKYFLLHCIGAVLLKPAGLLWSRMFMSEMIGWKLFLKFVCLSVWIISIHFHSKTLVIVFLTFVVEVVISKLFIILYYCCWTTIYYY